MSTTAEGGVTGTCQDAEGKTTTDIKLMRFDGTF